jgi:hypothetical protein
MDAGQADSAALSPFVRYLREEWCRLRSATASLFFSEAQARELRQTIEHVSLEEVSEVDVPVSWLLSRHAEPVPGGSRFSPGQGGTGGTLRHRHRRKRRRGKEHDGGGTAGPDLPLAGAPEGGSGQHRRFPIPEPCAAIAGAAGP